MTTRFRLRAAALLIALAALASLCSAPAFAHDRNLSARTAASIVVPCTVQSDNTCIGVATASPLPVAVVSGGGGGGSSGGTATAAAPSYTEGATDSALSLDLTGDLRTTAKQSGAWSVSLTGTVPLPTGAATAARQPALGTAGSAATDVLTVQGISGGTALPVDTVTRSTATDRGASIGTSATQLMAANAARRGIAIQVQSSTANCWINGQATATADYHSLKIAAGTYYESPGSYVSTGAISIICDTAATAVYAREW